MEFGVSARVERCKSSGLLMALARATPGTKLHKNGCLGHEARRLPIHLTSVSLVDGVLTLLNVVTPLSKSRRAEPRPLAPHVNLTQLKGKARTSGDCELSARARPNVGITVSTSKLTWSSERGTTTYVRCPMASAAR